MVNLMPTDSNKNPNHRDSNTLSYKKKTSFAFNLDKLRQNTSRCLVFLSASCFLSTHATHLPELNNVNWANYAAPAPATTALRRQTDYNDANVPLLSGSSEAEDKGLTMDSNNSRQVSIDLSHCSSGRLKISFNDIY